jgi:hypothetical protein
LSQTTQFEHLINNLDLQLFSVIETQSSEGDRKSWLALQRAIRRSHGGYTYLEIGSHLGGSIQQHLPDPQCRKIFSIDKRPLEQPDARLSPDARYRYPNNSTERMLQELRKVDPFNISKITYFDCDASDVDPTLIDPPPDMCLIDGEHTYTAVLSDFEFCLKVCSPNAVIYFHDASFLAPILLVIERRLRARDIQFVSLKMLGNTYAIALANSPVLFDDSVKSFSTSASLYLYKRILIVSLNRYIPESVLAVVKRYLPDAIRRRLL